MLFQMGLSKHPELPDVPLIMDLAKTDEERAIFKLIFGRQVMAWPFATPPGVPQDRVDALRKAFTATMHGQGVPGRRRQGQVRDQAGRPAKRSRSWCRKSTRHPPPVVRRTVELLQ